MKFVSTIYLLELKVLTFLGEWDWFLNVTCNDNSVIYVTAQRSAGGLKKLNLRSGSQRHWHFVGFVNVPVQAPTRGHPFYTVIQRNRPIYSPFTTRWGYGGHFLILNSRGSHEEVTFLKQKKSKKNYHVYNYAIHLTTTSGRINTRTYF